LELSMNKQPLKRLIRGLGVYLMPLPNKKIWLGATKEPNLGFNTETTLEAEEMLIRKGEALMPALAKAKIIKQWANVRPHSKQGGPILGWDKNLKGLYHATGHGGIGLCFAPYTANKIMEDFS
ncbi:MAG: glycine/D-amino acid oxidase-like deaminating enzyme, partial [bacterium]